MRPRTRVIRFRRRRVPWLFRHRSTTTLASHRSATRATRRIAGSSASSEAREVRRSLVVRELRTRSSMQREQDRQSPNACSAPQGSCDDYGANGTPEIGPNATFSSGIQVDRTWAACVDLGREVRDNARFLRDRADQNAPSICTRSKCIRYYGRSSDSSAGHVLRFAPLFLARRSLVDRPRGSVRV